jgi:hypothetical protein
MSVTRIIDIQSARTPLHYALAYADRGWHVFPVWGAENGACRCGNPACKAPGKHPVSRLVRAGMIDATTDHDNIRRWWGDMPEAGVGVSLAPSGLVAVDVDPRNNGYMTLELLEERHGRLETDLVQLTQGGGEHRFFHLAADSSLQLPGKLGDGIDLKRNGYSVLPPTTGPQGVYDWESSSNPLDGALPAPLPDWIRSLGAPVTSRDTAFAGTVAARHITEGQVAELRSALETIDADDRDNWVRVLGALHNLGSVGWDIALEWSQRSDKFDPQDQVRVWRSVQGQRLNYETIFHMAINAGWQNPFTAGVPLPADQVEVAAPPPRPRPLEAVPEHLQTIPGVLGEGVAWFMATAKKPQIEYALPAMLALASVVLGRKYVTDYDNWPALYFLAVGKSATGKESIKSAIEDVLSAAQLDSLIAPDRYSSESAGFSMLESKPTHITVQDEFGKLLQAARGDRTGHARSTVRFLLEAWGRAGGTMRGAAYSTAGMQDQQAEAINGRVVHNPSVTLVGLSTPSTFGAGLTRDAVDDGFLNRLVVSVCDGEREPMKFRPYTPPPPALVNWCQAMRSAGAQPGNLMDIETPAALKPSPTVIKLGRGVPELFFGEGAFESECLDLMNKHERDELSELFGRTNEIGLRMSLIVALSCNSATVEVQHARWAIEYARFCSMQMLTLVQEHLHEGGFDAAWKDVARLVAQAGSRGYTRRELVQRSRSLRKLAEVNPVLQDKLLSRMTDDGVIQPVESSGVRGRKRVAYVWVDADE